VQGQHGGKHVVRLILHMVVDSVCVCVRVCKCVYAYEYTSVCARTARWQTCCTSHSAYGCGQCVCTRM
jgi:hypothetical protein